MIFKLYYNDFGPPIQFTMADTKGNSREVSSKLGQGKWNRSSFNNELQLIRLAEIFKKADCAKWCALKANLIQSTRIIKKNIANHPVSKICFEFWDKFLGYVCFK